MKVPAILYYWVGKVFDLQKSARFGPRQVSPSGLRRSQDCLLQGLPNASRVPTFASGSEPSRVRILQRELREGPEASEPRAARMECLLGPLFHLKEEAIKRRWRLRCLWSYRQYLPCWDSPWGIHMKGPSSTRPTAGPSGASRKAFGAGQGRRVGCSPEGAGPCFGEPFYPLNEESSPSFGRRSLSHKSEGRARKTSRTRHTGALHGRGAQVPARKETSPRA